MVKKVTNYHVLIPFLSRPFDRLHLAFISKEINEPHPTVRLWLKEFVDKGVLKKEVKGRMTEYMINPEHQNIIDYLTITEKHNLISKCEDALVLRELVNFIMQNSEKALLFGTAAIDFSSANDIDILIIGNYDKKFYIEIERKINRKFHIISLSSINKISSALKNEIIKKHLLINGTEDFLRWFLWQQ